MKMNTMNTMNHRVGHISNETGPAHMKSLLGSGGLGMAIGIGAAVLYLKGKIDPFQHEFASLVAAALLGYGIGTGRTMMREG